MLKHVHQTSSSGLPSPNGSLMGSPSRSSGLGGQILTSHCNGLGSPYRHYRRKLPARDTLSIDSSVSGMSSVDSSSPTPCDASSTCTSSSISHEPLSSRSSSSSSLHYEVSSILRHIYNKSPPTVSFIIYNSLNKGCNFNYKGNRVRKLAVQRSGWSVLIFFF